MLGNLLGAIDDLLINEDTSEKLEIEKSEKNLVDDRNAFAEAIQDRIVKLSNDIDKRKGMNVFKDIQLQ